ncbi:MAG: glycosyltransferase [Rhodothermales bacterium]|nr:glycosyltransferase [Rhodothermales bacterium]MBO6779050.1 glycosyltransferase [Rhodothermales bacterium]
MANETQNQNQETTPAAPAQSRADLERTQFAPVRRSDSEMVGPREDESVLVRRIFVYGFLSLILFGIIWFFMEDPNGWLSGWTGEPVSLSWAGLIVYSSIVALVLFLVILLFRYLSLMNMAYLNTTKHTIEEGHDPNFLPPVSIIVPAYNEGKLLKSTVASLLEMDYPQYEILLVDDGSTDDTRDVAREVVGIYRQGTVEVRLVEKPNGGKATALNAGIQVSRYDYVLNVDGDSQLSPDTLRKTIRHFVDPRLGAIAGNVKVLNRDNVWTTLQALEYVEGLNMARSAQSIVKLVNIIPGPLGLFRKQAILDAGWYSSDTFAEDADITLKIIRAGWRVEYEPDAKSYTEAPDTIVDLLKQRYRWTRGIIQAVRKHNDLFFNPTINFGGTIVMWSMAFEALIWPIMNIFANAYFIFIALVFDMSYYLVYWWLSLTILDLIAALYCVAVEKEEARLVFYSLFYRLFFILIVDVCKTFATVEEFLGIGMSWGKLERIGSGSKA